jgi:hypothetical protein
MAKMTVPHRCGSSSQNVRRSNSRHGTLRGVARSSGSQEAKCVQRVDAIRPSDHIPSGKILHR